MPDLYLDASMVRPKTANLQVANDCWALQHIELEHMAIFAEMQLRINP